MPSLLESELIDLADLDDVHPVPFAASTAASAPVAPSYGPQELTGQVGAEVASPLSSALERVNLLAATGKIGQGSLRALREELERARRAAMMGQQISRLSSGRVKQAPEALDLPQLMRDMLSQRSRELESRGLEVRQIFKPAPLVADATLMFTLLQALFDWSFEHCRGRAIHIVTDMRTWPVHARLGCEFAWRPADEADAGARTSFDRDGSDDARNLDSMAWRLLERVAHTMGVIVNRDDSPSQVRLTLEFPQRPELPVRTTTQVFELDLPDRLALNSEPIAGRHVLVVSPRREVRNLVRESVRTMGLMVDYVTSIDEAREFCRGGMPHAVLCDASMAASEAFQRELQDEVAGLAFLQITEEAQALEVQTGGAQQQTRVGLRNLIETLPSALVYALERAR